MNWKNLNFYKEKRRGCHDSRWVWIECEFILSRTCHDLTHHCPLRIDIIDIELYLDLLTPRQGLTNTNIIFSWNIEHEHSCIFQEQAWLTVIL